MDIGDLKYLAGALFGRKAQKVQDKDIVASAESPHCNPEVLHAPGSCEYCDLYPERQKMRAASGTEFTPAEANGWEGNIAKPTIPDDFFGKAID